MPISNRDLELLSAYLDNALSSEERGTLERRLDTDTELRREWASLRGTRAAVRALPTLKAPRDFTLTRAQVRPPLVINVLSSPAVTFISAAAALVLVVAGILLTLVPVQQSAPAVVLRSSPTMTATNIIGGIQQELAPLDALEDTARAFATPQRASPVPTDGEPSIPPAMAVPEAEIQADNAAASEAFGGAMNVAPQAAQVSTATASPLPTQTVTPPPTPSPTPSIPPAAPLPSVDYTGIILLIGGIVLALLAGISLLMRRRTR